MEFKELVLKFARLDAEQKRLKKQSDPLKDDIKKYMSENDLDTFKEGPVSARYEVQERRTMNESKLVERLKALGFTDAIRTVEVPDENAIEDLIYEGKLSPAELDDCVNIKHITRLTVKGGDKLED